MQTGSLVGIYGEKKAAAFSRLISLTDFFSISTRRTVHRVGILMLAVLDCYLSVLSGFYCQAKPISKRKIPFNNIYISPSENKPPPPEITRSPAKRPFEQIQAQGLLLEFYGIL